MRSHWYKSERESMRLAEAGISKEVNIYIQKTIKYLNREINIKIKIHLNN